jgi:hypothetical protein
VAPTLYVDVDAVAKLAHWQLLPELPALTGFPFAQMATVSSLKHRAHRATTQPDGKLFRTAQAAQLAHQTLQQMGSLDAPATDLLAPFADAPGIDSGEAILMAHTLANGGSVLVTGDKRALRALAVLPIAASLAARILILEQIVRKCLGVKGRSWLLVHMCPHREIDKAIGACLGSQCDASEANILQGLQSYASEMENLVTPSLLHPFPTAA